MNQKLNILPAKKTDRPTILSILKELDLYYKNHDLTSFSIVKCGKETAGIFQLINSPLFSFLASLGITEKYQNMGIASMIMQDITENAVNDIYLYTIIPKFFRKFGFAPTTPPHFLPPKDRLECNDCFPKRCVCMIRAQDRPHTS